MYQQKMSLTICMTFTAFMSLQAEGKLQNFWYGFHEVTPQKFYRSSQMPPDVLKKYVQRYGIKTVVNLRGKHEDAQWWIQEKKVADECSVEYVNIPMSCDTFPSKNNLVLLLAVYTFSQLPILVHCKGGAERSGEASAIWLLDHEHASKEEALDQLSLKYWYIRFLHPAKRRFIELWQDGNWARHIYNPKNYSH